MKEGFRVILSKVMKKVVWVETEPRADANARHMKRIGDLRSVQVSLSETLPTGEDFYNGVADRWASDLFAVDKQIMEQEVEGTRPRRTVVLFNRQRIVLQ